MRHLDQLVQEERLPVGRYLVKYHSDFLLGKSL